MEKNDLQAEHHEKAEPEVFGREAARPYVLGIVAAFSLAHDRFDWSLAEAKWAFSAVEPYGVDARRNKMALATANSVQLIDMDTGEAKIVSESLAQSGTHCRVLARWKETVGWLVWFRCRV